MAVQQRIIGGGLLIAGIAVVLILIFLFIDRSMPYDEAYAKLRKDIYPRYVKAKQDDDYDVQRRIAEEAIEVEKATTMPSVLQEAKADAAKGEADAVELLKLLDKVDNGQGESRDAFENNVAGLYSIDGRWYDLATHGALRRLQRSLDEALPALVAARKGATAVAAELENLRLGSGAGLEPPAADASIKNPVFLADATLLRVYGLPAGDVTKALAAKGQSPKATSARLVWNKPEATSARTKLAQDLRQIPRVAETIERAAVSLAQAEQDLKGRAEASKQASELLKQGARQLAAPLEGPARQAFEAAATITSVADALKQEAKLLKGYASNVPALGQALAGAFAP